MADKKKVLLVDDDAAVTRLLKEMLELTGRFEVLTENNGSLALATARRFRPQVIFLDINMPDMEGSAAAEQIKADPILARVPVVFLTGAVTSQEIGGDTGVIGGQTFLPKPVTSAQLVACIDKLIGS